MKKKHHQVPTVPQRERKNEEKNTHFTYEMSEVFQQSTALCYTFFLHKKNVQ